MGVVAGIVLVIVVARVLTGQAGFTESGLSKRIAEQQRRVEQLELSVAQLRSPQRIYERATKLGLVPAGQVIFLTPQPSPAAARSVPSSSAPKTRVASSRPSTSPGRGGR